MPARSIRRERSRPGAAPPGRSGRSRGPAIPDRSRALAPAVLLGALAALCACAEVSPRHAPFLPVERPHRNREAAPVPATARNVALAIARAEGVSSTAGAWTFEGPTNVPGRVTALAVDPTNPARIWAGAAAGGVFLSQDDGATFVPVFDDQTALSIGSLAAHPTDPAIVYVGTGEDNGAGFTYDGEGVFKTTDGGATWTPAGLGATRRIGALAVDPTDGDRVFAAAGGDWFARGTARGIYRTTDGGATWQQVLFVADDTGGIDVEIDPADPDRVFAAMWERSAEGDRWTIGGPDSGVWRSLDGGDTWSRLSNGLPSAPMGRIGLAIAPSDPNVVFALVIDPNGLFMGLYRSLDGGDTWARRDGSSVADWFGSFGYYFGQVRVDPSDADTVYLMDIRLLRSTNGGKTVRNVTNVVHIDYHDLVADGSGRLVAATDGGVWISPDDGSSWTRSDLPTTQIYDLAIDATDPSRRLIGTQDNGTQRTTTGSAGDWAEVLFDDGMHCEIDPTDPDRVYASTQYGGFRRSTDGGDTFTPATDGIASNEPVNWAAPLTLDPTTPTTMYTGTDRVYRSTDGMVSWLPTSPPLDGSSHGHADEPSMAAGEPLVPGRSTGDDGSLGRDHTKGLIRGTVTAIAVSPIDTAVVWAGTDDGHLWVTSDGGTNWSEATPPGPKYWITDIAADPRSASGAFVAASGARLGDPAPSVRRTRDLGATWEDVTGDLPGVPVGAVHVDTDWVGRVFAGTDLGVFVTDDGGVTWSDMRAGMPYVVVLDLVRHETSDVLFAGTHGRSMFAFDLAQLGVADGDGDGVDNNLDCALADAGAFAPPTEVVDVRVETMGAGTVGLSWLDQSANAGAGTTYDVARGSVTALRTSGDPGTAETFACALADPETTDPASPVHDDGFWYVVRATNSCGDGTWGASSSGAARDLTVCP